MKTKCFVALGLGVLAAVGACKEKTIDSPEITVVSPKVNEAVSDKDSVRIEAILRPKTGKIANYLMTVTTKNGKMVFNAQRGCDCKSKDEVDAKIAFFYDTDKTLDLFLEIKAILDDGREMVERVPFVLKE